MLRLSGEEFGTEGEDGSELGDKRFGFGFFEEFDEAEQGEFVLGSEVGKCEIGEEADAGDDGLAHVADDVEGLGLGGGLYCWGDCGRGLSVGVHAGKVPGN